jgi:transposase
MDMGRKAKHIQLTVEQDSVLRELEQQHGLRPKVRLRAQEVRLSAKGWTIPQIAEHVKRNPETVRHDLLRWERGRVAGLADRTAPGKLRLVSAEIEKFMREALAEERVWDCTSLGEAIYQAFGVRIGREALRSQLQRMGYRWKRTRFVPAHAADPSAEAQARKELEKLKRGPSRASIP